MDVLAIAGFLVAVIGTAFGVAVALRARQLTRPQLHLTVGHPIVERDLPRQVRHMRTTALVIGTSPSAQPRVVGIPFFLENGSDAPISDLSLRIEYPAEHLLTDGTDLSDPADDERIIVMPSGISKREAVTVLGRARVSVDLATLRPRETAVAFEFLHFGASLGASKTSGGWSDPRIERATQRYRTLPGFRHFTILDVVARSSNAAPIAASLSIIVGTAESLDALIAFGGGCAAAAWDGRKPKPGIYFDPLSPLRPPHLRKPVREERVAFLLLPNPRSGPVTPTKLADRTLAGELSVGVLYFPPWGLTGEGWDMGYLGQPIKTRAPKSAV